eukprot:6181744-Pleurochrysis_carterae.AAC.4
MSSSFMLKHSCNVTCAKRGGLRALGRIQRRRSAIERVLGEKLFAKTSKGRQATHKVQGSGAYAQGSVCRNSATSQGAVDERAFARSRAQMKRRRKHKLLMEAIERLKGEQCELEACNFLNAL